MFHQYTYNQNYGPYDQHFQRSLFPRFTATLIEYFNKEVQLRRDEKKAAYSQAMPIMVALARFVHEVDPRFGADFIKVGSAFQGLKVSEPNEYDVNIPLLHIDHYNWSGGVANPLSRFYDIQRSWPPKETIIESSYFLNGFNYWNKTIDEITIYQTPYAQPLPETGFLFVQLNSRSPAWLESTDMTFNDIYTRDIIPIFVKKQLKKLIRQGIRELGLDQRVSMDKQLHGPAITINIKNYMGPEISVDFSPVVSEAISFPAGTWPHENTMWPSEEKKQIILNIGVSFVAKRDIHWMLSAALAEKEIMKGIDYDGGCRKKSHRIMKKLNEDLWTKEGKAVSSYALKNLLLWQCEKYPHFEQWTQDKLGERVMWMTSELYDCIMKAYLPTFFLQGRNLIKKDTDAKIRELHTVGNRIKSFLDNPLNSMLKLMND